MNMTFVDMHLNEKDLLCLQVFLSSISALTVITCDFIGSLVFLWALIV